MTDVATINSTAYWDGRFAQNWEACQGPAQSRFFARLALERLPRWLVDQIRRDSLTVCDWGCAQGDGTDVWASYVDSKQLTGVDFSPVAIEQARRRYPAIRFKCEDWLAAGTDTGATFDLVFSSNTLEHFHDPYEVLHLVSRHATKGLILALPYREADRIDEHFYTFLPINIPVTLRNGFRLICSRVVDCRSIPGALWGGEQVVLVYAERAWADAVPLVLEDCLIGGVDADSLSETLAQREAEIVAVRQALAQREAEVVAVRQAVAERDETVGKLLQNVAELQQSTSWRLTSPLRAASRGLQAVTGKCVIPFWARCRDALGLAQWTRRGGKGE